MKPYTITTGSLHTYLVKNGAGWRATWRPSDDCTSGVSCEGPTEVEALEELAAKIFGVFVDIDGIEL